MQHLLLFVCLSVLSFYGTAQSDDGDLVLVQIVHRHGDRTPVTIDPAYAAQWAAVAPPGMLTTVGMAQHRVFGTMLREQYQDFLDNGVYVNQHVHVRSTDFDRTLMSVESLLSQLYPEALVPIHTLPNGEDYLLQPFDTCPSYTSQATQFQHVNDAVLMRMNTKFVEDTLAATGFTTEQMQQFGPSITLLFAYDNYMCMKAHQFVTTQEYDDIFPDLHQEIKKQWFNEYVSVNAAADPRGPIGAALLAQLVANMNTTISNAGDGVLGGTAGSFQPLATGAAADSASASASASVRVQRNAEGDVITPVAREFNAQTIHVSEPPVPTAKLYIYSAHDTTLLSLFAALELIKDPTNDMITPPYASSVVFELRRHNGGQYTVSARYGHPNATGIGTPAEDSAWLYWQVPISLNCPDANMVCAFADWAAHAQTLTANVGSPTLGCCYTGGAFSDLGCDQGSVPPSALPGDCLKYRSACPASACSAGSVLAEASMTCVVAAANGGGSGTGMDDHDDHRKYKDYVIGLGVVSGVLLAALLGSVLYFRHKLHLTSYGTLQERMSHAQFV